MPLWLIPMVYTVASIVCAFVLPRLEHALLPHEASSVSVSAAMSVYSAISSGMMALTGVAFAIAFVIMQFGAGAYSPRLAIVFGRKPIVFHAMGLFFATFAYSLAALAWVDRNGSGRVPQYSAYLVFVLLVASMLMFARLVQSLSDLQIHNVLQDVGARGRAVIRTMFPNIETGQGQPTPVDVPVDFGPLAQTVTYEGEPCAITRFDIPVLVRLAASVDGVIVTECSVGDTLVDAEVLLRVYGASRSLPEHALTSAIHVGATRTFEQDPRYAIRLLVDIAIRALSPAINDPTTAVQALDQIEDLLRRLGRRELDTGRAFDASGRLRVVFPTPTWDDYLGLAFDEIRQFGATSVQVARRMRSALIGLKGTVVTDERRRALQSYLDHLNLSVGRSDFDDRDKVVALEEDRQGLGLSRKHAALTKSDALPARPVAVDGA